MKPVADAVTRTERGAQAPMDSRPANLESVVSSIPPARRTVELCPATRQSPIRQGSGSVSIKNKTVGLRITEGGGTWER